MSFLAEFKSLADKLKAEEHALAGKAESLFGHTETLIAGIVSELRPALTADVKALTAEAVADGRKLETEALADVKTELAAIKALLGQAVNPAPVPAPAPAQPPAQS